MMWDHRLHRYVKTTDLPEGFTVARLNTFLRAHQASFYSLESFTPSDGWTQDPERFRAIL